MMKKKGARTFAACSLLGCAAIAAANETQLETVVVTAQRRAEDVRDVPMSISTIRDEKLDVLAASGRDIRILATRAPGLHVESDFGRSFPRFYLRGLGNTDFDLNASQPVSVVFDDVVQESPLLKSFPLFDINQVEVLRGPQGSLFGRNSTAGVVKIDANRPRFEREGYAVLGMGQHGTLNTEGAWNEPLGPHHALRFSFLSQHRDSRVKNPRPDARTKSYEGYHDTAARLQWLYQPHRDFSALANVHWREMGGRATLFRANVIRKGSNELVDGFDYYSLPTDGFNRQSLDTNGASLRLRWNLGGLAVHSITGVESARFYSRADVDAGYGTVASQPSGPGTIPFTAETADALPEHEQWTQEFRVESDPAAALGWLAGVYAFSEKIAVESYNFDTLRGNVQNGFALQHQDSRAWAAFGSVHWRSSPELMWRAGARYTDDRRDFSASRTQATPGGVPIGPLTANPRSNKASWDASVVWNPDPMTRWYARVATGYRAPSIQGRIIFGSTISVARPEQSTSIDVGVKRDLFDRRARASLALYQYRVKDMQLTAGSGAVNQNRLVNAARVEGKGAEAEFQRRIGEHWQGELQLGYTDVVIKDPGLFVLPCGNGCTVLDPRRGVGTSVLIDGNPLPRAPRWTAAMTVRYARPVGDGQAYVLADAAYRGKYNFFLYEAVEYRAKPLTEIGLRAGYQWGGRYEVAAYVRNLRNKLVVVNAIDFNNFTGVVSEPRAYGLQLRGSL
jgi:iron complex outermembrane receptor protein